MEDVGNGGELIWLDRLCAWTLIEFKIMLRERGKGAREGGGGRGGGGGNVYIYVKTCM